MCSAATIVLHIREIKSQSAVCKGPRHKSAVGRLWEVETEAERGYDSEVSSLLFAISAKPKRGARIS